MLQTFPSKCELLVTIQKAFYLPRRAPQLQAGQAGAILRSPGGSLNRSGRQVSGNRPRFSDEDGYADPDDPFRDPPPAPARQADEQ